MFSQDTLKHCTLEQYMAEKRTNEDMDKDSEVINIGNRLEVKLLD